MSTISLSLGNSAGCPFHCSSCVYANMRPQAQKRAIYSWHHIFSLCLLCNVSHTAPCPSACQATKLPIRLRIHHCFKHAALSIVKSTSKFILQGTQPTSHTALPVSSPPQSSCHFPDSIKYHSSLYHSQLENVNTLDFLFVAPTQPWQCLDMSLPAVVSNNDMNNSSPAQSMLGRDVSWKFCGLKESAPLGR